MRLIVVRHAEAVPLETEGIASDFHRTLTDHGRKQAAALAEALKRQGVFPKVILTSPLVRAVETAEPLARELTPGQEYVVTERLASGEVKPKKLSRTVLEHSNEMVVVVGHMPDLGEYIEWLLGAEDGAIGFEKAAAACILCPHAVAKGGGTLEWLVPPTWFMPPG